MSRGFTFIEVLVSLLIVLVLMTSATPSWRTFYQKYQMKALAVGFQDFFIYVRSEAVFRNKNLWVHFEKTRLGERDEWTIYALDQDVVELDKHVLEQKSLSVRQGKAQSIYANWSKIKISGVNGRPGQSGHIIFSMNGEEWLKVIFHNITGRVRVCSVGDAYFGYPEC